MQHLVQQVRIMMFSLNMVDYSMSFLLLSTWIFFTDKYKYFLRFFLWNPFFILERYWVVVGGLWVVGGGLQHFSVIPSPLGNN